METAIDYLKNGKSPGIDGIPAEFIKCCTCTLSPDITLILNYIIGLRDFPTLWTEGLKSVLLNSGSRLDTGNYRGITILPIIEKIFQIIVYQRLSFANDAFNKKDKFNGGFQRGSRTADNIFILVCSNDNYPSEAILLYASSIFLKRLTSSTAISYFINLWKVASTDQLLTLWGIYIVRPLTV